jgi:predicted esterase
VPSDGAVEAWAVVQEHVQAIAHAFSHLAHEHVYPGLDESKQAEAFVALARAADSIVSFSLFTAIAEELRADLAAVFQPGSDGPHTAPGS